ncbi:hypothetical protein [Demequina iriomotensis]|uniref:hypothetical protein n=1 Tax=Demequina iriomotensis TaxID=1536641 RepID=UPI0007805C32|nr:hypothetical protein [Demequina iriomotensis]
MDSDFTGGPGFLAFVATFAMVAAAILLFRSLGKHLRKVRTQDARDARAAEAAVDDAPDGADASSPEDASGDAEGGEGGGDEVTGEAGDR